MSYFKIVPSDYISIYKNKSENTKVIFSRPKTDYSLVVVTDYNSKGIILHQKTVHRNQCPDLIKSLKLQGYVNIFEAEELTIKDSGCLVLIALIPIAAISLPLII